MPGVAIITEACIDVKDRACVDVCPVDCIDTFAGPEHEKVLQFCSIDLPRCIGCTLCAQVCPWDCITMVPTDQMIRQKKFADQVATK